MVHTFIKTCIGYSHIKDRKVCQDSTSLYQDTHRTIITCCDGHGGDIYIRSSVGSSLASRAIVNVLSSLSVNELNTLNKSKVARKIKLLILCEWNKLVEEFMSKAKIKNKELSKLNDEEKEILKVNPVKAYGTTLTGALLLNDKLLMVGIGDTEVMLIKDGKIERAFESDDDPVGNITYSMCQEDAYNYLRVRIVDFKDYDGVLLCTDGLSSPYQSYSNFNKCFVKPVMKKIREEGNPQYVDNFIEEIALKLGVGDDVSVAMILNDKQNPKYKEIDDTKENEEPKEYSDTSNKDEHKIFKTKHIPMVKPEATLASKYDYIEKDIVSLKREPNSDSLPSKDEYLEVKDFIIL